MKKIFVVLLTLPLLFGVGCVKDATFGASETAVPSKVVVVQTKEATVRPAHIVDVKYRGTPVNLWNDKLEEGDVLGSSFVWGAFYDREDQYLILFLTDTYYQYCGVPEDVWDEFLDAESHGSYFNESIRNEGYLEYCEETGVPELE